MMRTIQCYKDGAFWSRTERCLLPRQFVIADTDEIFLGRVALSAKSDPDAPLRHGAKWKRFGGATSDN